MAQKKSKESQIGNTVGQCRILFNIGLCTKSEMGSFLRILSIVITFFLVFGKAHSSCCV